MSVRTFSALAAAEWRAVLALETRERDDGGGGGGSSIGSIENEARKGSKTDQILGGVSHQPRRGKARGIIIKEKRME